MSDKTCWNCDGTILSGFYRVKIENEADIYYCSEECLHEHWSDSACKELSEQGNLSWIEGEAQQNDR